MREVKIILPLYKKAQLIFEVGNIFKGETKGVEEGVKIMKEELRSLILRQQAEGNIVLQIAIKGKNFSAVIKNIRKAAETDESAEKVIFFPFYKGVSQEVMVDQPPEEGWLPANVVEFRKKNGRWPVIEKGLSAMTLFLRRERDGFYKELWGEFVEEWTKIGVSASSLENII
jgi:hypothetical protein